MNICGRSSDPKTTLKNIDGRGGNRGGDGCYLLINYSNAVMGSVDNGSKESFICSINANLLGPDFASLFFRRDPTSVEKSEVKEKMGKDKSSIL